MFAYKMLRFVSAIMLFSVGYFFAELLSKKFGNNSDKNFLKYARIVLLIVSFGILIWLVFNKELFHWNYDIATGKPVNHYSTYGKCIVYTIIALVSNTVAAVVGATRKDDSSKEE